MSRVGKAIVNLPDKVEVSINGNSVSVKGPKGELSEVVPEIIKLGIEDSRLVVEWAGVSGQKTGLHGLWRMKISNMVEGVSKGFTQRLELVGVGYKVQKQGEGVEFSLGYSHPIMFHPSKGNSLSIDGLTKVIVSGIDKVKVGQDAADIRSLRPPEPYKGKGIQYEGEVITRKAGKSGKAGGKK